MKRYRLSVTLEEINDEDGKQAGPVDLEGNQWDVTAPPSINDVAAATMAKAAALRAFSEASEAMTEALYRLASSKTGLRVLAPDEDFDGTRYAQRSQS